MSFTFAFFKRMVCGGELTDCTEESWVCRQCSRSYPVKSGIPIMVRDWHQTDQMIEALGEARPGWYKSEQSTESESPWRHHLKKHRDYLDGRKATALFDLVCEDGKHLDWLQYYTSKLYGGDYNLLRLARANAYHPYATVFLADILNYPAQDNFFEVIFFNHVVENIPDDGAALQEIYRILKPGSVLVLGTPNEGAWWRQLAYRLQLAVLKASDRVNFYTTNTLTQIMQQGFRISDTKHLGWRSPHWSLDRRIRGYKIVDHTFETVGHKLLARQIISL